MLLAVHRSATVIDVEKPPKEYFREYLQHREMTSQEFQGVCLDDLCSLERVFRINIFVYELKEAEEGKVTAELVRRSPYTYEGTMILNLNGDHFSYNT